MPSEEQARAHLYALAARLLLAAPDAPLLDALAHAAPSAAAHPAGPAGGALDHAWGRLRAAAEAMPARRVAEEFAALFEGLGPPLVDPCESAYLAGLTTDKPLARLRADLAALGLSRVPGAGRPEDHLGALFETMRLTLVGAPGLSAKPRATQREFLEGHLGPWTERCLRDIERAKPASFYRRVAGFVRALLELERSALGLGGARPATLSRGGPG